MQFVKDQGPTKATAKKNVITFAPLKSLGINEKATWIVEVKAIKAGDVRFGASVKCDQQERPTAEAESTEFYE